MSMPTTVGRILAAARPACEPSSDQGLSWSLCALDGETVGFDAT